MLLSKRSFFLSLLVSFGLMGCNLPGSKNRPGEPSNSPAEAEASSDATFFLTILEGKFSASKYDQATGIVKSRTLTMTACFKDKVHKQDIVGHRFLVRGGSQEIGLTTNGNACIVWLEEIDFNFFADEYQIQHSRDLIPQGQQKGLLKVNLVIDPWSEKVLSPTSALVVNPIPAEKAKSYLRGATETQENRTIFVESVRANIVQEKINVRSFGGRYSVDVVGSLMGERYDRSSNQRITFDLPTSAISAQVQLICVYHPADKNPQRAVIAQFESEGTILNAGRVTFSGKVELKEYCASTATLMVAVTAKVKTDNPVLVPFNGIFVLGQVQYTVGTGFSLPETAFAKRFILDRSYTVEDFLAEGDVSYRNGTTPSAPKIEEIKKSISQAVPGSKERLYRLERLKASVVGGATPEFLQPFTLEFDSFALNPYQYEKINGYAKNVRREYNGRACLRLGIDGNSVRNIKFKLTKMNGEIIEITTANNGCFEWVDTVTFNYLGKECRSSDHAVSIKSETYGLDRKIDVIVNPWSSGTSSAPVVLWYSGSDKERPRSECVETKSQIIIGYYYQDYYVDRFQYSIDKYLGLSHMRLSNLALIPKLKRPTFGDRRGFEDVNLPVGKYLLRYAIIDQHVRDYSNAAQLKNHVYTVHRSVVAVRADGAINDLAPMETAPDAIASLGVLNQLVVEVVPLKESAQHLENIPESEMESYVDEDTNIEVSPFAGGLIFQSESGGFRQIPEWQGKSLVNHVEEFYNHDRKEIEKYNEWVSKKENAAQSVGLTLFNTNSQPQLTALKNQLWSTWSLVPPKNRIGKWLQSGEMTSNDVRTLCNFFFNKAWRQPLASKRMAYHDVVDQTYGYTQTLADSCYSAVGHSLVSAIGIEDPVPVSAALDIQFKYFVKNPRLVAQRTCLKNIKTSQEDCDEYIAPKIARQSINISENFFVAKDYGAGYSHGWEGKAKAEFGGSGMGWGISVGSASVEVQGNSKAYTKGMAFDIDALKFKVRADDVERCLSIRLNPALISKKERWSYLWTTNSVFAKAIRHDLTDAERNELLSRGLLICEGQTLGRPVTFDENYYFIRSSAARGLVADTMSSRNFQDWFTSLRGAQDFANFRSLFQTTYGTPKTVEAQVNPEDDNFAPIQANFARGSRSMPGVFSTHKPLRFDK